ncbi:MAG: protease complex subunit PrcB family protein [Meiothermus sp.]|nr:protease complex subunit PrcB family protein [Meiothermus sp.]
MKHWIGLLAIVLTACVPQQAAPQPYTVSELQVLFPNVTERWVSFDGGEQTVKLDNTNLALKKSLDGRTELVGGLFVNGQAWLTETSPAQPGVARASRVFPGQQYALVNSRAVLSAWLFDGLSGGWVQLGGGLLTSSSRQLVDPRPGNPSFASLTQAETSLLLREVLGRRNGQQVVLYEVEPPLPRLRFEPAPAQYKVAAFAVQYGLETEFVNNPRPNQPSQPLLTSRTLQQGGNSAYSQTSATAYLVSTVSQLNTVWQLALGNQVPVPPAPAVNFAQSRVVAFFWGQKSSGGYAIQVVGTQFSGTTLRVTLNLRSPEPGAITTQALTSPFVLLEVSGRPSRVEFVDGSGRVLAAAN